MGVDRRQIAPMMVPYFPSMADPKLNSDDWHGFLNAMSGLEIEPDEPNATAFDKWREALSAQKGLPVWGYTAEQKQRIRERGEELKRREDERIARQTETLKFLAFAAPTKTAQQLIDDTKKANR